MQYNTEFYKLLRQAVYDDTALVRVLDKIMKLINWCQNRYIDTFYERVYNRIMYTKLKGVCQKWQRKKYMMKILKK